MIDKNMFKSKLFMLFLIFFIGFIFLFLKTNSVSALEPNQIELDFSKVENPWNLSNKINFTLPLETENKLYHINVNPSNNELIIWIYENPCSIDGQNLTSVNQNFYLKVYEYNSSTQKFDYHHDWTHSNKSSVEKFYMLYSSYSFKEKTKFPNWTYAYENAKDYLSEPSYKSNLEYFIGKLKSNGYAFIISIDDKGKIKPILSKNKKEFSIDFGNNDRKYTTSVVDLNRGWGIIENDVYSIDMLTKEFVDSYIKSLNQNFDKLIFSTFGDPFLGEQINNTIVLYSSFSDNITLKNYLPPVFVKDVPYVINIPTFDTLNLFFDGLPLEPENGYEKVTKIKVSDLYNYHLNAWKNYQFIYLSKNYDSLKSDIRIELVSDTTGKDELPIYLYLNENVYNLDEYMKKVADSPNSDPDGFGGGFSLSGGDFGGGD